MLVRQDDDGLIALVSAQKHLGATFGLHGERPFLLSGLTIAAAAPSAQIAEPILNALGGLPSRKAQT